MFFVKIVNGFVAVDYFHQKTIYVDWVLNNVSVATLRLTERSVFKYMEQKLKMGFSFSF